ncbi:SafA/ExsA family spore coat assembly protein, partial [Aquibacillus albus]|nr:morphogenetic protein associated with SpoVID [Aquibacillus albus]
MKIHVVQQGETLWKIAQKYGVDFEELKKLNSHLSNPDMIMPGMKIKIPSSTKQVKKEEQKPVDKLKKEDKPKDYSKKKEQPLDKGMKKIPTTDKKKEKKEKEDTKPLFQDTKGKSIPEIKEDDYKKPKKGKEKLPKKPLDLPKMPMMEHYMEESPDKADIPQVPHFTKEKEFHHHTQTQPTVPIQPTFPSNHQAMPHHQATFPAHHQPMMPVNYPSMPYCVPTNPVPYPVHHHAGYNNNAYAQPGANNVPINEDELMESSSMEMPEMPTHLQGMYEGMDSQGYAPIPGAPGQGYWPTPGAPGQGYWPTPGAPGQGYGQTPGAQGQGYWPAPGGPGQGYGQTPGA